MITPEDFFKNLFETFDGSAVELFKDFIKTNAQVTKWMIASDYCLRDMKRPNSAYAFSIIPYDAEFADIKKEITNHLPKDIKKTKELSDSTGAFLRHGRLFHIGFVLPHDPQVFNNHDGTPVLETARKSIKLTLEHMEKMNRGEDCIRRLRKLKQNSYANNFNYKLLSNLYILAYLFPFVSLLLARECQVDLVGWFSDRDKMTEWCDGIVWNIATETLYGMSEKMNINLPKGLPVVGVPAPDENNEPMWFDELVRLPDYIAGLLSALDFAGGALPTTNHQKNKYMQMAQDVIADSKNTVIIKIRYDNAMAASRILVSKSPI